MNQLQLSSGEKTQNSSNKQPASSVNQNYLMDLKTPDKCAFEFNSMVSGTKNFTQDKFSHEKFQISSNSVEKILL